MKIVLGRNFSREFNIIDQILIINEVENDLNNYFRKRYYGNRIEQIYIGIICVSKSFEQFFPLSNKIKINRTPSEIEYGVKLNFDYYISLSRNEKIRYIYIEILKRTEIILPTKTVNDFDKETFLADLKNLVMYQTC